jgi:large conductance mechanosensitive channel
VDFSKLFINLSGTPYATFADAKNAGAPVIAYGAFLNSVLDFVIVAFVIFLLIRQMNKLKKQPEAAPAITKECSYCLSVIPLKATRCAHCTAQLPAA